MSVFKKAIVGSAYLTLSNYVVYFFAIAVQLLLARWLLPADFGFFAVVMASVEIVYVLLSLDLGMACLQSNRDNRFHTALGATHLYFFVLLLLAYPLYQGIAHWRDSQTAYYFLILLFARYLSNLSTIYAAYLEKDLLMGKLAIARAACRVASLVLGLSMAQQGFGVASLLIIEIANAILITLCSLYLSPLRYQSAQWYLTDLRPLLNFAFAQYIFRVTAVMLYKAPVMIVEVLTGNKHLVGLLDRALYVASLPNAVTSAFHSKVAFILFKNVQQNSVVFEQYLELILWVFVRFLMPLMLALTLFPREIIGLILGPQWLEAAPMLASLGVYAGCMVLYNILNQVCMSLNVLRFVSQIQFVATIGCLIVGCSIYFLKLDWYFLTVGVSIFFIVMLSYLWFCLHQKKIKLHFFRIWASPFLSCLGFLCAHHYVQWAWYAQLILFVCLVSIASLLLDQHVWRQLLYKWAEYNRGHH